ncbi:hypothetical protein NL676_032453 [Syzygium grande]|nr:hypothetical protein NL676_032453 [Syzygium grande]
MMRWGSASWKIRSASGWKLFFEVSRLQNPRAGQTRGGSPSQSPAQPKTFGRLGGKGQIVESQSTQLAYELRNPALRGSRRLDFNLYAIVSPLIP